MTETLSGGVPEQGLRDALEIIERHAALWAQSAEIYECSAPHDTLSKATCVGVRDTLRTIASEMRAALERPRPALPAEPPQLTVASTSATMASGATALSGAALPAAPVRSRSVLRREALPRGEAIPDLETYTVPAEHAPPDTLARFIGALLEQQHSDKWWESVPPDVKDVYRTYANEAREIVARGSRPSLAGGREEQIDAIAKLMQDRYPFRAAFAQIAREMYDAGVRAALSDREGKMNHD